MKRYIHIIAFVLSLAVTGYCAYALFKSYKLYALIAYGGLIVCFPLSYLLHELGHTVLGFLCKFKVTPHFSLFGPSSCSVMPKTEKHLKSRLVITAFGGIIVNFILLIFSALALFKIIPLFLCVFLPSSAYILIVNLTPYDGLNKTDIYLILSVIKNTDEGQVTLAVLKAQSKLYCGASIESLDKDLLFSLPQIREDDESFIALTSLRYEYIKATEGEEKAEPYKKRYEYLQQYVK